MRQFYRRRFLLPHAATLFCAAAFFAPVIARAQKPVAPPGPPAQKSASPAAPAAKQITLAPTRPGQFSFWTVGKDGTQSAVGTLAANQKSAPVSVGDTTAEIHVLDEAVGLIAVYPVDKLKDGASVPVSPADFTRVKSVQVSVTAGGGKPVEKASVSLTDVNNKTVSRVLTASDNGVARFEDVPVGKASVSASYGEAGGPKVTQETTVAPPKGGGAVELSLALSGDNIPTLSAPAANSVSSANGTPANAPMNAPTASNGFPAADNSASANNWIPGVVGLLLLAGGIVFGIRYAQNKGVTVPGVLKQMGVEMPQDAANGANAHLKPAAPVLPPLASLGDLPSAGAAPGAVAVPLGAGGNAGTAAVYAAPASAASGVAPRLVGLVGPVGGETFPLDSGPLSVGRDAQNTLALTQDTTLSRNHARIEAGTSGTYSVTDNGSSNGTFVNGQRIAGTHLLRAGDEIQIGASRFRFEA